MSNTPKFNPFFVSPVILEKDSSRMDSKDWCVKEDLIQSVIVGENSNVQQVLFDADKIEIENGSVNRNDSLIKVLFAFPKYITQFFDLDLQDKATNKALCSYMSIMYANVLRELTKAGFMSESLVVLVNKEFKEGVPCLFDYLYQCCAKVDIRRCHSKRASEVLVCAVQAEVDLERIRSCCLMYIDALFKVSLPTGSGRCWKFLNECERDLAESHKFVYVDKFLQSPDKVLIYQHVRTNPDDVVLRQLSKMFVPYGNKRNLDVIELITALCNIKSDFDKFMDKINVLDMSYGRVRQEVVAQTEDLFSREFLEYYRRPTINILFGVTTRLDCDRSDWVSKDYMGQHMLIRQRMVIEFVSNSDVIAVTLDELLTRTEYYSHMLMRV